MTKSEGPESCCCGSAVAFDQCCGPLLGGKPAPTAEALMRSRYSAFVHGNTAYLEQTLSPEARTDYNGAETEQWIKESLWQGLEIRSTTAGEAADDEGTVEFVARYKLRGKPFAHHERATFRKDQGRWLYVDGMINPQPPQRVAHKVGRNDSCPCGSGKKFKKCCGA